MFRPAPARSVLARPISASGIVTRAALLGLAALATATLAAPRPASADETQHHGAHGLHVEAPKSRPGLPNRPMAAYLTIHNPGETEDRLLSATSPEFDKIEIHTVREENGVFKMLPLDALAVPAGGEAVLEPGGNHLMLFGAKRRFKEGEAFPVTLGFEHGGEMEITVEVTRDIAAGGHHHGHGQSHGKTHGDHQPKQEAHQSQGENHSGHGTGHN